MKILIYVYAIILKLSTNGHPAFIFKTAVYIQIESEVKNKIKDAANQNKQSNSNPILEGFWRFWISPLDILTLIITLEFRNDT